jgi:predicted phosphoribosyltransferase
VVEDASLREREAVFRDRTHAGRHLAGLLEESIGGDELVLAIPAGGVPVAAALARELGLEVDLAVVSKITLPWNSEAGYGAVAFDGTHRLNHDLLPLLGLSDAQIRRGVERTRAKVERRVLDLRAGRGPLSLADRPVIVVDDGLASGMTMRVAVEAVERAGTARITVAVPTGHADAVRALAGRVHRLVCANVRTRSPYAVASAYQRWHDVTEREVLRAL